MTTTDAISAPSHVDEAPSYGNDTRWSMGIFVARSLSSLVFVLATSRALGSGLYGALAALSAATSIGAVLTTSGIAHAATMFASRSSTGGGSIMRSGLRAGAPAASAVTVAFLAASVLLDDVTVFAALALFVADVLVAGLAEIVASTLIGLRRFRDAASIWIAFAAGRALAAAAILSLDGVTLETATTLAMLGSFITIPVAMAQARRTGRHAGPDMAPLELVRAGGVFTAGNLVARLNNDFDKLLLSSRLGSVSSVGTYAVGYRLVEYSLLPLTALSAAAYPRMFKAGAGGTSPARGLARRLAVVYQGTALLITAALFLGRDLAELVFGSSYGDLSVVITMLLGVPLLRSTSNLLGEPLTGSGHHRRRVWANVIAACVNVAFNVAFLDEFGWRAAVWATYASEITLVACLAVLAVQMRRQDTVASRATASSVSA